MVGIWVSGVFREPAARGGICCARMGKTKAALAGGLGVAVNARTVAAYV